MSYSFAVLACLLAASVITLLCTLRRSMKHQVNVAKEFKSELKKLFLMLFTFTLTYAIRFFGDYLVIPLALREDNLAIC